MIDEAAVRSIVSQYERFGWQLHHVLLSPEAMTILEDSVKLLFGDKAVTSSNINALWFSRQAANGRIAWELRAIGDFPFALVESSDPDDKPSELDSLFERTEMRMYERLQQSPRTH